MILEVIHHTDTGEIVIAGNGDGLKYLASAIQKIAEKNFDGAHEHFDEHNLDRCDIPLVIRLKKEV